MMSTTVEGDEIASLTIALKQYQQGYFQEALSTLDDGASFYEIILRSRTLVRLGRSNDALALLNSNGPSIAQPFMTTDEKLELAIAKIFPASAVRNFGEAETALETSKSLIQYEHSIDLETELHYGEAAYLFTLSEYERAKKAAERSLSAADDFFSNNVRPEASACFKEHNRAKSLQILALICSNQGRYHEQAYLIRTALQGMSRMPVEDAYTSALLKLNLGYYVRDLDSVHDADLVEPGDWPSELDWLSSEIARSLALYNAGQGNFAKFDRWLKAASKYYSSPAFDIILATDRNLIDRCTLDHCRDEDLNASFAMSKEIDWNVSSRFRFALYLLAQELSYIDSDRALQLLSTFQQNSEPQDPLQLHDRRDYAEMRFAFATVHRNAGQASTEEFFEAFDTWNNVGYRKYAAMAAVELAELTGRESFIGYARREAALRPGSWLDQRVRRMKV